MPERLFSFKYVPDDEAEEVRQLLHSHAVEFYETPTSKWGFSPGAIWLKNDDQLEYAKELIDEYQENRAVQARKAYEELKEKGEHETLTGRLRRNPLQMVFYLFFICFILYVSIMPFINISN